MASFFLDLLRNGIIFGEYKPANEYEMTYNIYSGLTRVKNDEGKYGIIDAKNEIVTPFIYDWMGELRDGIIGVKVGELYGALNSAGREIIPPISYERQIYFSEDVAIIRNEEGYHGAIDRDGAVIIPLIFTRLEPFHQGLARISVGSSRPLKIDKELNYYTLIGKERIDCEKCNRLNDKLMTDLCCLLGK